MPRNTSNNKPEIAIDDDFLVFTKEMLTKTLVKSASRRYPSLKIASGEIMPVVVMTGYEWENLVEILEFDFVGIASILAGAANDGGKVGVIARKMSYPIRTASAYTEVPWLTIQQSAATGIPLSSKFTDAIKFGTDKYINKVGYFGDTDYGLQGLLTSPLTRINAVSTLAAAANPDVMLNILNNAVSQVVKKNRGLWLPKILVLPLLQQQLIANTYRTAGSGDLTVQQAFLATQKQLGQIEEIIVDDTLAGVGDNGSDVGLVLPGWGEISSDTFPDSSSFGSDEIEHPIFFGIARDLELPSELAQWNDTIMRERGIIRLAGCIVSEPFSGGILQGI